jgi:hypothetical protein
MWFWPANLKLLQKAKGHVTRMGPKTLFDSKSGLIYNTDLTMETVWINEAAKLQTDQIQEINKINKINKRISLKESQFDSFNLSSDKKYLVIYTCSDNLYRLDLDNELLDDSLLLSQDVRSVCLSGDTLAAIKIGGRIECWPEIANPTRKSMFDTGLDNIRDVIVLKQQNLILAISDEWIFGHDLQDLHFAFKCKTTHKLVQFMNCSNNGAHVFILTRSGQCIGFNIVTKTSFLLQNLISQPKIIQFGESGFIFISEEGSNSWGTLITIDMEKFAHLSELAQSYSSYSSFDSQAILASTEHGISIIRAIDGVVIDELPNMSCGAFIGKSNKYLIAWNGDEVILFHYDYLQLGWSMDRLLFLCPVLVVLGTWLIFLIFRIARSRCTDSCLP